MAHTAHGDNMAQRLETIEQRLAELLEHARGGMPTPSAPQGPAVHAMVGASLGRRSSVTSRPMGWLQLREDKIEQPATSHNGSSTPTAGKRDSLNAEGAALPTTDAPPSHRRCHNPMLNPRRAESAQTGNGCQANAPSASPSAHTDSTDRSSVVNGARLLAERLAGRMRRPSCSADATAARRGAMPVHCSPSPLPAPTESSVAVGESAVSTVAGTSEMAAPPRKAAARANIPQHQLARGASKRCMGIGRRTDRRTSAMDGSSAAESRPTPPVTALHEHRRSDVNDTDHPPTLEDFISEVTAALIEARALRWHLGL